jgi:hypothetical protein
LNLLFSFSKLISVSAQSNKTNGRILWIIGNTQLIVQYASPFLISSVYKDKNDRRIAGMTEQLEWPDSWNNRTAGTTGQLERPDLEQPDSWNDRTDNWNDGQLSS